MYESFGQEFVLQDRVLVDPPVHAVPPLAACCTIVLDPLSVPPPHVLEHDPQLHALHSQLKQARIIRSMSYICCILLFSSQVCFPKLLSLILVVPESEQTTSSPSSASRKPLLLPYFQERLVPV